MLRGRRPLRRRPIRSAVLPSCRRFLVDPPATPSPRRPPAALLPLPATSTAPPPFPISLPPAFSVAVLAAASSGVTVVAAALRVAAATAFARATVARTVLLFCRRAATSPPTRSPPPRLDALPSPCFSCLPPRPHRHRSPSYFLLGANHGQQRGGGSRSTTRRLGRLGRAAPSRTGRAPYPARRKSHSDEKRGSTGDSLRHQLHSSSPTTGA